MAFDVTRKEKLAALQFLELPLTDLHIHMGASVAPHVMWSIANQQGLRLPVRNYWEFLDLITVSEDKVHSVDDYLQILHKWTEKIQSSPAAIERCTYEIISKEYRGANVTTIELRFNPMKRNLGGERDLDHIIHAAIRGMDQAVLEYSCKAGLIFCMAREFSYELNEIIVEKAIRYHDRGVVGIDMADPEADALEGDAVALERYATLLQRARDAGLKVTIHTGETERTGPEGMATAIRRLKPHRIGHGIQAARSPETMKILREEGVVLEVCPSSNLWCRTIDGIEGLRTTLRNFIEHDVPFTINTDGTYLLRTDLMNEFRLLHEHEILTPEQMNVCVRRAREASFLR
jgi:adenosine deaminase